MVRLCSASEATKDIVRTVHVTRGDTPTQLEDARRLDIYLFFQTTHVYDEKFPIPTILVCMRAKKIPKGRAAGAARRGVAPPLVHSNKERLGAKRGLFCARRCSGMCAIALYYYTHHDRHSCPIQKLRVIAQASLHSAHYCVMLDKPQD